MKVTVVGGGSIYTPEVVNGFLERSKRLPLKELWLMDIDGFHLEIVGGFVQRLVQKAEEPFRIITSDDLKESIAGADIVITQLRVSKMQTQREDEYMGMRHGLIGQETTAIGGMSKALHAIPMILEICDLICEHVTGASLPSPYHSTIIRW